MVPNEGDAPFCDEEPNEALAAMEALERGDDRMAPAESEGPRTDAGTGPKASPQRRAKPATEAAAKPAERPTVRTMPGILAKNTDDALRALAASRSIFRRGGMIVRAEEVAEAGDVLPIGTPVLRRIGEGSLAVLMSRCILWETLRTRPFPPAWVPTDPPKRVVLGVLGDGGSRILPPIVGLLHAPSIRADGSIITRPGYDDATGYYLASEAPQPRIPLAPMPEEPTQGDANKALVSLLRLFSPPVDGFNGFPWACPERDPYVPIAALLSLLARPALPPPDGTIPMFVIDATTPGVGKGKIIDVVSLIGTGQIAPRTSWSSETEEQDKQIGAVALQSPPLVFFDNVRSAIENEKLEGALTGLVTSFRILGTSETPVMPWRTVVFFAGNNLEFGGDMLRRAVVCRIEPTSEDPSSLAPESFLIPYIEREALDNRGMYLCAALTMLRAYILAKMPDLSTTVQSFVPWSRLVGGAIAYAGGPSIAEAIAKNAAQEPPHHAAMRVFLREWSRLDASDAGLSLSDAWRILWDKDRIEAIRHGGKGETDPVRDPLREAIELLAPPRTMQIPDPARLGVVLRSFVGRVFDGRRLAHATHPSTGKPFQPIRWRSVPA